MPRWTPEARARRSEQSRSPEHLAKLAAARAARTPEQVAAATAALRAWNASPAGAAQTLRNLDTIHASWLPTDGRRVRSRTLLRRHLAAIRERDGDLCQLCLTLVDFSAVGVVTLDHIVPWRAGGSDEPANLWIAHRTCNSRKGARWIGRRDGSTDPRRAAQRPVLQT